MRQRRIVLSAVREANCTESLQKMGQFVAKMGNKTICYDFLKIMKIVMMVAGNCNVENMF